MQGIKFNEQGIKGILNGSKTMTRRPMKQQPIEEESGYFTWFSEWGLCIDTSFENLFQQILENEYGPYKIGEIVRLHTENDYSCPYAIKITGIKVERLHDISEEDCIKEGFNFFDAVEHTDKFETKLYSNDEYGEIEFSEDVSRAWFEYDIWDKLPYQPPYDWDSNPYVFVYEFEVQ